MARAENNFFLKHVKNHGYTKKIRGQLTREKEITIG